MRRYLRNLIYAIAGRDSTIAELSQLQEKYEKESENVTMLREMYFNAVERWDSECRNVRLLHNIIENLRTRIKEKDDAMRQMAQLLNEKH